MGRSAGGGVGGVPVLPPVGPSCAWRGAAGSGWVVSVPRLFLFVGVLHPIRRQCTSSVRVHRPISGAAPHNGCSAPYQVQRPRACGGCGDCRGCGGLLGLGCLLLGLSSAWGTSWCLMLWFLKNVARNSPTCISNIEITPLEFCGFLDTYEKLGYPNYVRLLVDEAPKANSCVRSSSHDTAHDPRDASNTTHTPHNAKSRLISAAVGVPPCGRDSHSRAPDRLSPAAPAPREAARETGRGGA